MGLFGFDSLLTDEELEQEMEKEVSFRVKEKHIVIVTCGNERETLKLQKELEQQGFKCDVKNT